MKNTNTAFLLCAALAICGCNSKIVTYETTAFDGSQISIDESNISYQKPEENVLETTKVPENLEPIAPGRDYVYLEDEFYYFVEDASRCLLTIARKEENTASAFVGENFMLTYRTGAFAMAEEGDGIKLSYISESNPAEGINHASFKLVKDTDCESLILDGATKSEEGGLTVVEYQSAVPCGSDVVLISVVRTLSNDDEIDMPVEADFENLFQSFLVIL